MALRNIYIDGDPILRKKCRPVEKFDDKLHTLLDDMHETLYKAEGVGLAAPQVGMCRRLFIMHLENEETGEEISVEGVTGGEIIDEARGEGGFGYDPYFYYPPLEKTFSELTAEEKNSISHRGRAVELMARELVEKI